MLCPIKETVIQLNAQCTLLVIASQTYSVLQSSKYSCIKFETGFNQSCLFLFLVWRLSCSLPCCCSTSGHFHLCVNTEYHCNSPGQKTGKSGDIWEHPWLYGRASSALNLLSLPFLCLSCREMAPTGQMPLFNLVEADGLYFTSNT